MENPVGSVPVPDPTLLTTQALDREIATVMREIGSLERVLSMRLDGMDRAQDLAIAQMNQVPSDTDKQIQHLGTLLGSRLDSLEKMVDLSPVHVKESVLELKVQITVELDKIKGQFAERDIRTEQAFVASKEAISAALQAAKEAVAAQNEAFTIATNKSESATNKLLDQLALQIANSTQGIKDTIDDLKSRLNRMEGSGGGAREMWSLVVGGIGIILAIGSVCIALYVALHR